LNWLHLVATILWIGGMGFNILILRPSLKALDPKGRVLLASGVLKRFVYLAWISIAALTLTGVPIQPSRGVGYTEVLMMKHGMVAAMIFIVGTISLFLMPRITRLVRKSGADGTAAITIPPELAKLLGRVATLVKFNLVLGFLVLLVTAFLQQI